MGQPKTFVNNILALAEVLLSIFVFCILYYLFFGNLIIDKDYLVLGVCMVMAWSILLKRLDVSKIYKINPYSYILLHYVIALGCGFIGLIFLVFLLQLEISRFFLLSFIAVDFVLLYSFIIGVYFYAKVQRKKGLYNSNILVIGDKHVGAFINKIESNPLWGYHIKGVVTDNPDVKEKFESMYTIYSIDSLKEVLVQEPIDELYYCRSSLDNKLVSDLIYMCLEIGVTFRVSSQILSLAQAKSKIYYLGESPYFTFQNTPKQNFNLALKSIFDRIFALCVLLFFSPVFLIIAILIKLDSKGPVFFKQVRSGLRGREFMVYKFRSMCDGAEDMLESMKDENEQEGPVFKVKNDKRITKIGSFLRKTSLDELPQFINVLKGDMSVVGPRPPLPAEVKQYKTWQTRRLSMKPGITCIWQVSGRNNIPFEQWMKLDLQYIDTWSLGLDFMIILKTVKTVLKHDGQ